MTITRKKPSQHLIADLIAGAIIPDCSDALEALDDLLSSWELTAGEVRNLNAARKELAKAVLSLEAALLISRQQDTN